MRRFTKSDIEYHNIGYGGLCYPAICVKSYAIVYFEVKKALPSMTGEALETLLHDAWKEHCDLFWTHYAPAIIREVFPELSENDWGSGGRMNGWLIVTGLGDFNGVQADWNGVAVARWGRLVRLIKQQVKALSTVESYVDTIKGLLEVTPEAQQAIDDMLMHELPGQ